MFFDLFGNADKNGDGRVDIWEAAEELFKYDSIMGTNISGFCPENDRHDPDLSFEDEEEFDEFGDEFDEFGDEFDEEDEEYDDEFDDEMDDEFDFESDECDEW